MSVNDLLQCLKKSRLLSDKQFDAVSRSVRSKRGQLTPEKVVDSLVKQELLTEWQGRMLLRKQSGFVLGQYTLLVPIGSGGMGKVFKAWDKTGQRHVAIKVLSRKLAKNKKLVARFRREIELASRLDSPYIVRAFDAGEVGESHFMVMEYVDGEGLDELAERLGRIRAEHACELIRQAALGLQFAHEQGMVHRDIKPANMILSFADGTPVLKLLDMGLARIEKVENDGMTRTGQVMGTPDYMAPEQGWNTADVDIRADIYSLGCSLFRLVTGSVPFRGDNPLQVLMARCSTDAPLASSIVPDLDARIDAVIRGMTWRDPSKRYQTPGEVAAALAPLAEIPGDDDFAGGNAASTPVARPTVVADSTSGEPSFQGFLRDMDGGSPVSLFDGSATDTSPGGTATEKIKPRTRARGKRNLLLAGAGGVLLLFVAGFLAGGYGGSGDVDQKKANAAQQAARRPVYLADVAPQSVQAGQVVSFTMAPDIPVDGDDMEYQLAAGAPESATLDPHTGEFYWIPDRTQDPGRVAIRVQARRGEQMVDERVVYVDVRAAPLTARILPFKDVELTEGEAWTRQIELFGVDSSTVDVRFALVGDPPAGLQLDANSGLLQWTPDTAAIGRHDLNIELRDPRNDKIVDAATCSLMVRPAGGRRPRLVALPAQTIEAGQQLVVDLTTDQPLPPTVALRLAPGSPPGARLDDNRRFVWTPPADSSGPTPIRVRLQQDGRVIGQAAFVVNVTARPKAATSQPGRPADAEVATAEKAVRELYRRDLSQNNSRVRQELAARLLARSFEEAAPAMRYALLKVGLELAERGRAWGTGVELIERLRQLYGTDSVAQTLTLIDQFRTRGTSSGDKALVLEAMFREALHAAESNRFQAADKLLDVAETIARTERATQVLQVLTTARTLLKSLPTDDDTAAATRQLTDAQQLGRNELLELLDQYQFEPVFRSASSVRFASNADDTSAGRDLWKIGDGRVSLAAEPSGLVTGFVDPSRTLSSFVFRMSVSAESTTGMLLLGTPGSGTISGYQIPLGGADLLHVKQTGNAQPLARPRTRLPRRKDGWDLIEVVVSGDQLAVLMNGTRVTEAKLPIRPEGSIGLIALLDEATPQHVFEALHPRVMPMPEAE